MTVTPLVLTCGEPAGVGPEIAGKVWDRLRGSLPFFLIGDPRHIPNGVPVVEIAAPSEAAEAATRGLPVLPLAFPEPAVPGHPDPKNAAGVIEAIERAVRLTEAGDASGVVTLPINKKALIDGAGFAYPGHTEFLAALAGGRRVVMMLACDALKVVPATIHIPIAKVPAALTTEVLNDTIRITEAALRTDFRHSRTADCGGGAQSPCR